MLLQVNNLPLKGMSARSRSIMRLLNICITEKLPFISILQGPIEVEVSH